MAIQTITGKAFEYSLLVDFFERLRTLSTVVIIENAPYKAAKKCFESFSDTEKDSYRINSSAAVNFIIDTEPRLSNSTNEKDILQLEIYSDFQGQGGDVRDVLLIRSIQNWEIGISAKNNHRAVKHSRLSNDINFGEKWLGLNCSETYFSEIKPVFDGLAQLRTESGGTKTWDSLGDYHKSIYLPILIAFRKELMNLNANNPELVPLKLVEYLIGNKDFYKVIKGYNSVEIQAYNIHGTLNLSFNKSKPKFRIPKLKLPNRLIDISFQEESMTTLLLTLNEGWQISFRIHNASSRIEASLKFDINLISAPYTLFTNHISVGEN